MSSRRRRRHLPTPTTGEDRHDGGILPELSAPFGGGEPLDRHLAQLCSQAQRALSFALGELEVEHPILEGLYIFDVTPAPSTARLLVRLAPVAGVEVPVRDEVVARLLAEAPRLRAEVAASIHRKRTPELMFDLIVPPSPADAAKEEE